jgi:hypothetical protein
MNAAAGAARSEDISSLKEAILSYAAVHSPEGELKPQINLSSSKSDTRGFNHPMLARLLCPIQYLDQFDENPKQFVSLMLIPDLPHSPLTRTRLDLQEGRIPFTWEDYPAFMYAAGSFDRDDMEVGLLRHEFPLAVSPSLGMSASQCITLAAGRATYFPSTICSVTCPWLSSCTQTRPSEDAQFQGHDARRYRIHHPYVLLGHLLAK